MSHLSDKHGISRPRGNKGGGSFGRYLKEHFPVPLCCCGCGKEVILHGKDFGYSLFAPGCKGLHRSRNPSCIEFYLHQEMSVDDAIIALSERQRQTAKRHSTQELRDELSKRSKGANNPLSYKSIQKRTGKSTEEIKQDLSLKSSGENNGFYDRTHTEKTRSKASIFASKQRSMNSHIVTKPELVMWGMLHALGVEFIFECFRHKYCVDFFIEPNIIIEIYGDYWHSDKLKSATKVIDGKLVDNCSKTESDEFRVKDLEACGYKVFVFWESELMKTPKESCTRLRSILDENQVH